MTIVPSLQWFAGLSHNFLPYSLIKNLEKMLFTPVGQNKHSRNHRSERGCLCSTCSWNTVQWKALCSVLPSKEKMMTFLSPGSERKWIFSNVFLCGELSSKPTDGALIKDSGHILVVFLFWWIWCFSFIFQLDLTSVLKSSFSFSYWSRRVNVYMEHYIIASHHIWIK